MVNPTLKIQNKNKLDKWLLAPLSLWFSYIMVRAIQF